MGKNLFRSLIDFNKKKRVRKMQIDDFFQMNDWGINKFLKVIFILQISVLGLIAIDALGLNIPFLRELVSLIYLLFVPGILIIRILKLHKLGSVQTVLLTVGLSIAILMFLGLTINTVGPAIGIIKPISLIPLITTISIFVIILSVISYLRDEGYENPSLTNINDLISPPTLALLLLPFLTIFGTYLMNLYKINALLILFLALSCLIVILFAYDRLSKKLYPLVIFVISISILFQISLISNNLTGWDVQNEYYLGVVVINNSYWISNFNFVVNSMLSLTILAPILSIILKMDLNWILKIIYPALFALVPLGLFEIFKKQTNDKIAFLSSFIFISFFAFYMEMISLARQEIAEIFLILIIMVMISKKIDYMSRSFFFIIFGASIAISHYSIAYFYMFSISLVYILFWILKHHSIQNLINHVFKNKIKFPTSQDYSKHKIINLTYLMFLIVFTITFYTFTSLGNTFNTLLYIIYIMGKSITTELMNPASVQSLAIIQATYNSPLHNLSKYINLIVQFFLVLGVLSIFLFNKFKFKFKKEFLGFMLVSTLVLIASITVPYFSSAFNSERLYQILLIFLAPSIVIGGLAFLDITHKLITKKFKFEIKNFKDKSIKILSVFFIVYLLFNSGLVYYLADDSSNSIALNSTIDSPIYNDMEINGTYWLSNYAPEVRTPYGYFTTALGGLVVADDYRSPLLNKFGLYGISITNVTDNSSLSNINNNLTSQFPYKSNIYLFFGTSNVLTDSFAEYKHAGVTSSGVQYINSINLFNSENEIYDNGGSQIYIMTKGGLFG